MATKNRLTEKHYNGKGYYMKCSELCRFDGHCANCDELVKIVDRLGEYEDKAKQAVEVVHGQWEAAGFDGHGDYKECCSNCKAWSIGSDKLFCPVCGAEMDGGADDGC